MKNILLVTRDDGVEFAVNVDRIALVLPRRDGRGAAIQLAGEEYSSFSVREPFGDVLNTLFALGVHAWRIRPAVPPPAVTLSIEPEEAAP